MKGNPFTRLYFKSLRGIKNNTSTFLTIVGAIGTVATSVLVAKETPEAMKRLCDATKEKGSELTITEKIVNAAPAYFPAISMCGGTLLCIFGANYNNKKKQASLISAYKLLETYFDNYRTSLISLKGEDVDKEVRMDIARRHSNIHFVDDDFGPDERAVFVEDFTGQSLTTYERVIMDAEYHLNRNFAIRGQVTLNEWLELLNLSPVDGGDEVGWEWSHMAENDELWIDFEHYPLVHSEDDGGHPIYYITTMYPPEQLNNN